MHAFTAELHRVVRTHAVSAVKQVLPYLLTVCLLLIPSLLTDPQRTSELAVRSVELVEASGAASDVHLGALKLSGGHGTLRIVLEQPERSRAAYVPLALHLSGLYSAEARWNGVAVGAKGRPGATAASETPGPIDAVLPVPPFVVRPGLNVVELDISRHHWPYSVSTIMHPIAGGIGVVAAPFSADQRRSMEYYAAPFLMLAVLALFLAILARRRWRGEPGLGPILITAALLLGAGAEISRAVIDYPYPWHAARQAVLLTAAALASIGFVQTSLEWSGLRPRRSVLAAGVAVLLALALFAPSLDMRSSWMLAFGAAAGCAISVRGWKSGRRHCASLACALALVLAFALLDRGQFLDRSLYAAAIPLLALFVARPAERAKAARPAADTLVIGGASRRRVVPLADVLAISGAGNYSEFELSGEQRVLDERTLARLSGQLPETFFRIHRSHIVNLDHVAAVVVRGAGQYRVDLSNGRSLPLSRTRVRELRAVLVSRTLGAEETAGA